MERWKNIRRVCTPLMSLKPEDMLFWSFCLLTGIQCVAGYVLPVRAIWVTNFWNPNFKILSCSGCVSFALSFDFACTWCEFWGTNNKYKSKPQTLGKMVISRRVSCFAGVSFTVSNVFQKGAPCRDGGERPISRFYWGWNTEWEYPRGCLALQGDPDNQHHFLTIS